MFVDRVNNYINSNVNKNNNHTILDEEQGHATSIIVDNDDGLLPSHLHAEMSTPGKKSNKNNGKCRYCREAGHFKDNCPKLQQKNAKSANSVLIEDFLLPGN